MNIELIPYGKENRIMDSELTQKSKLKDKKQLKEEIELLKEKYIIMSEKTNNGNYFYWRCNDKSEMQEFIKKYQSKAYDTNKLIMLAYKEMENIKDRKGENNNDL